MGWTFPCYCLAQCSIDMAKMMLRGYNLLVLNVGFFQAKCWFLNFTDVESGMWWTWEDRGCGVFVVVDWIVALMFDGSILLSAMLHPNFLIKKQNT